MDQWPAHLAVTPDRGEPLSKLADRLGQDMPRRGSLPLQRRRFGQPERHERGGGIEDRHDDQDERWPRKGDEQGAEEREADGEGGLERDVEHAHRGLELRFRDDARDHRRLGRGEHDRRQADPQVERQQQRHVRPGQCQAQRQQGPDDVRDDEREPHVPSVDQHAGHRREQDRRDQERHDEGADRGVRPRRVEHQDGQGVQRHVAADLGRRLDEPDARERRIAQDRDGSGDRHRTHGRRDGATTPRAGCSGSGGTGSSGRTGP